MAYTQFIFGAAVAAAALFGLSQTRDISKRPFPQHVAYAGGSIKQNAYDQDEMDEDVRDFYAYWKGHYVLSDRRADGRTMYRISFGKRRSEKTVSEGQGYGMIIVALMAGADPKAHKIFDGLWTFARQHPSHNDPALMAWKVPVGKGKDDSAFDGDADMAYALILADAQWGSAGSINYRAAAQQLLTAIMRSTVGQASGLPLLGDWVASNAEGYDETSARSSDFMPSHFHAFARYTGDQKWNDVASQTQKIIADIQAQHSPETGLVPDFLTNLDQVAEPAAPNFLENEHDGHFANNAARVPLRFGMDALLNGDRRSAAIARKMSGWVAMSTKGDAEAIRAGYQLDGTPIEKSSYFTTLFAGPLGVAAMSDPRQQQWLNAIYDACRMKHADYYEDSINMISMLVISGNYWDPTR
jgi:endoglucanase